MSGVQVARHRLWLQLFFLADGRAAAFDSARSFSKRKARSRAILARRAHCSFSYSSTARAMSRSRSAFKAAAVELCLTGFNIINGLS
jgi:hypothetical protein